MKYFLGLLNAGLVVIVIYTLMISSNSNDLFIEQKSKSLKTISFSDNVAQFLEKERNKVLETQNGRMSAYGPDCVGCSGGLAGGYNARGGNYIFSDSTYGDIRIVAGDKKYPFGTIVRISGSSFDPFYAIVLDRGGDIGLNRKFMFDLLCSSEAEASRVGSFYDVKFEILRYGY